MDGHERELPLEAVPPMFASLGGWIIGHVLLFLKGLLDTIVRDLYATFPRDVVGDHLCPDAEDAV